ncbi:MAG: ferredoxin [Thermoplasmatota archaeon]
MEALDMEVDNMQNVEIDQDTCIGCGMCETTCPQVFKLGEKVKSTVVEKYRADLEYKGEVPDDVGCTTDAEENCPVGAIKVS